jgi:lysozyme
LTERQTLIEQLIRHEGIRLKVYRDIGGVETIGVGRNLRDVGISYAEALTLLDHDLNAVILDLATFAWWGRLSVIRQRALIDLRFNVGGAGFRQFVKLIDALSVRDYDTAAAEILDSDAARLLPGRYAELAVLMATGEDLP